MRSFWSGFFCSEQVSENHPEAGHPDSLLPLIMNSVPLYEYISRCLFIPLLVGFTCDRVSGCHEGEFAVTLLSESSVDA